MYNVLNAIHLSCLELGNLLWTQASRVSFKILSICWMMQFFLNGAVLRRKFQILQDFVLQECGSFTRGLPSLLYTSSVPLELHLTFILFLSFQSHILLLACKNALKYFPAGLKRPEIVKYLSLVLIQVLSDREPHVQTFLSFHCKKRSRQAKYRIMQSYSSLDSLKLFTKLLLYHNWLLIYGIVICVSILHISLLLHKPYPLRISL